MLLETVLILLLSYLLGCLTSGYYLVKWWSGQDIRTLSSGNVGSRNVSRLLGCKGFVITFIGDASKGALVIWIATHFSTLAWLPLLALLLAVVGHIWPLQLGFRGGKGVATFLGGLLLWQPYLLLLFLALSGLLSPLLRSTTAAGLLALTLSPLLMLALESLSESSWSLLMWLIYCGLTAVILYAHRENITSLLQHARHDKES